MSKVNLDTSGLEALRKTLENIPKVKLGIMGDGKQRKGEATNVEVGIAHEFGTENQPQRSFLRVPLAEHFGDYYQGSGLGEEHLKEAIEAKNMYPLALKLGQIGETVISDAFQTGGFGEWKESDMSKKKVHQTLVETQQLWRSVTFRVDEE